MWTLGRRPVLLAAASVTAVVIGGCGAVDKNGSEPGPGGQGFPVAVGTSDSTDQPEPSGDPYPDGAESSEEAVGGAANRSITLTRMRSGEGPITLLITESGAWAHVDLALTPARTEGRLSDDQQRELRRLLADPALVKESKKMPDRPNCDGRVQYTVSDGASVVVMWTSCGSAPKVAGAIYDLLADATPL